MTWVCSGKKTLFLYFT